MAGRACLPTTAGDSPAGATGGWTMTRLAAHLRRLLADERGAVAIHWVTLSAGVLLLAIGAAWGVFGAGLAGAIADTNATLIAHGSIDFGSVTPINVNH